MDTVASVARIEISADMPVPIEAVWAEIVQIENHPSWMADAEAVEFLTERTRGSGTRIRVQTRIGPFRTTDVMEFTEWHPPRVMGVTHQGLFTGAGRFTLEAAGDERTVFTWTERILFPWWLGGPVGAAAATPFLRTVWKGNLRRLRERLSSR